MTTAKPRPKVVDLNVREVQWPDDRVTSYYSEDQLELLRSSLSAMGQVEPIIVMKVGDAYYGIDGLHRWERARDAGQETIPAVLLQGEEKDVYLYNLTTSVLHGRPKASEIVKVLGVLFDEQGVPIEELVARTGMSQDWVEKHLTVAHAVEPVRRALDEEMISLSHAYVLARVEDPQRQEMLLYQQLVYRWPVKDLEKQVKTTAAIAQEPKAPTTAPVTEAPATAKCNFCREEHPVNMVGHVPVCVSCSGKLLDFLKAERQGAQ